MSKRRSSPGVWDIPARASRSSTSEEGSSPPRPGGDASVWRGPTGGSSGSDDEYGSVEMKEGCREGEDRAWKEDPNVGTDDERGTDRP